MPLFENYAAGQDNSQQAKNNAELALCELEMGIAEPGAVVDALLAYADALSSQRSYEQVCELCGTICSLCDEHSLERQEAVALIKLGAAKERLGRPGEARTCYTRSLELSRELYAREQTEISRDDLAVASFRLGFIEYISGEGSGLVEQARTLWTALYEDTGNYEYRRCAGAVDNLLTVPVEVPPAPEVAPEPEIAAGSKAAPVPAPAPAPQEGKRRLRALLIAAAVITVLLIIELAVIIAALL